MALTVLYILAAIPLEMPKIGGSILVPIYDKGYMNIYISTLGLLNTDVKIEFPWGADPEDVSLGSGGNWTQSYILTKAQQTAAVQKGIRVRASEEISLQVSRGRESKTKQVAYTAMPVSGGSYYLSSRPLIGNTALQPILMVGAGDKAVTVSVKSEGKEIVSKEVPANTVSTFKAIDLQSGLNLTGVLVEVSEPAAVYSGHICGHVPSTVKRCGTMLQQIPPTSAAGREYIAGPIRYRQSYTVTVIAVTEGVNVEVLADPGTVTIVATGANADSNCTIVASNNAFSKVFCPASLVAGGFVDLEVNAASWPMVIKCSANCQVYQFNHGLPEPFSSPPVNSGPFMSVLVPWDKMGKSNKVRFSTVTTYLSKKERDFRNTVTVIGSRDMEDLKMNGSPLRPGTNSYITLNNQWIVYSIDVEPGFHEISTRSELPFIVQVHGHFDGVSTDAAEAYGYPAQTFAVQIVTGDKIIKFLQEYQNILSASGSSFVTILSLSIALGVITTRYNKLKKETDKKKEEAKKSQANANGFPPMTSSRRV